MCILNTEVYKVKIKREKERKRQSIFHNHKTSVTTDSNCW